MRGWVRGSTVYGIPLRGLRPVRTRLQSTVLASAGVCGRARRNNELNWRGLIIAEEISSPIKSSSYDVPSIILSYSVSALEAIIAAQSPLHCHFSIGMQLNFAIIAQRYGTPLWTKIREIE